MDGSPQDIHNTLQLWSAVTAHQVVEYLDDADTTAQNAWRMLRLQDQRLRAALGLLAEYSRPLVQMQHRLTDHVQALSGLDVDVWKDPLELRLQNAAAIYQAVGRYALSLGSAVAACMLALHDPAVIAPFRHDRADRGVFKSAGRAELLKEAATAVLSEIPAFKYPTMLAKALEATRGVDRPSEHTRVQAEVAKAVALRDHAAAVEFWLNTIVEPVVGRLLARQGVVGLVARDLAVVDRQISAAMTAAATLAVRPDDEIAQLTLQQPLDIAGISARFRELRSGEPATG